MENKKEKNKRNIFKKMVKNFKSIKWPQPKEALADSAKVLVISVAAGTLISMADTLGKAIVGIFI